MTALPDPAASRAVLIGTGDYVHLESIPAVSANLGALADTLCSARSWGLAREHCTVIEDPVAAVDVLEAVRTAAEEATDTLLVYFAGHGLVEPRRGELYLGLTRSMPQRSYTGLPYGALRDVVLDGRADRQVMLLDCCFSGRALGFMASADSVVDRAETEGTYLLAAVPDTSYALAPPGEPHTAFTGEVLRLLRDGVPDGPELLDLDTVYARVHAALRAKGRPLPQKRARNSAGRLALARNAAWVPPGFGPPPPPHPVAPPRPTWSPPPATGGPRRRRIRAAVVGAVSVALLAAGIPLARGWLADGGSGDGGAGKPSAADGRPKDAVVTTGYDAATKGIVNPSKRSGGELRFVAAWEDSWDPQRMYSSGAWNFARYFTRQLVTWSTEPGEKSTTLVADLAKDTARVTDGGRTYTYTLREGVTWENGKPVTARDIKYGIERGWATDVLPGGPDQLQRVLDPQGTYRGPYKDAEGLKAIETHGESTIVFRLPKPDADFEQLLAMPAASPVPKSADRKGKYGERPLSSGPYEFVSRRAGGPLKLRRNKEWNKKSDPIRTALPDTVRLEIDENPGSRSGALFSGRYDLELTPAALEDGSRIQALARGKLRDQLDHPRTGLTRFLALPRSVTPMDNVHCRRAVRLAVDRTSVQKAFGGAGAGGDLAATLLPPSIGGSTTGAPTKADISAAKDELRKCGRTKGFSTIIAVRGDRTPETDAAEAVQDSLKRAGITARIEEIPFGEMPTTTGSPSTVEKKGYGIILTAWGADVPTGQGFLQPLADSRFIEPTGNYNFALVDSTSINDRFDAATGDRRGTKAAEHYERIDEELVDDAAYVPLLFQRGHSWRGTRLTNVHTSDAYSGGYDVATLGVKG